MNQDIPEWTTDDFRQSRRVRDIPELAALAAAAADRPCRYAVYPQELALRTRDSVNEYVSLEKALGRASERARAPWSPSGLSRMSTR